MSFQQNINKTIGAVGVASRANDIRNLKGANTPSEVQVNPVGQLKNLEPQKVQTIMTQKIDNDKKARELYLQRVARIGKAREAKLKKQIEELKLGGKQ